MISLFSSNWQKILIQGNIDSGKSDVCYVLIEKLLNQSENKWLNNLIDEKDKILLFTEKVSQVDLIDKNILNKIHVVENISSKNCFDYLVKYYQNYGIEYLVIDYINLLNGQSHLMKDLMQFVNEKKIKCVFIQNTFKLLKPDFYFINQSDTILSTSKGNHGIEVSILKEDDQELYPKKTFWIDFKKNHK